MKDIPGLENKYAITPDGKVWSYKSAIFRKPYDKNGYKRLNLGGSNYSLHRLVAQAFIPNPLDLPDINHKNGITDDNRVENLEWSNQLLNMRDAINRGTHSSIARRSLSPKARVAIMALNDYGTSKRIIAKVLGVSEASVKNFLGGSTYAQG